MDTSSELETLAQEIAQQTKADIQVEVKAVADTLEKEKESFTNRLRLFFSKIRSINWGMRLSPY